MNISMHQDHQQPVEGVLGHVCQSGGQWFVSLEMKQDNMFQRQAITFIFHDPAQLRQVGGVFEKAAELLEAKLILEILPPPTPGLVPKEEEIPF